MEHNKSKFEYVPLKENCIRLVQFCPASTPGDIRLVLINNVDYEDISYGEKAKQQFVALSYCWGDPHDVVTIKLNGHDFNVTRNLHAALVATRTHHNVSAAYWVDAICIDQTNKMERGMQVAEMWQIYWLATRVFAWLGSDESSVGSLFYTIRGIHENRDPYAMVERNQQVVLGLLKPEQSSQEQVEEAEYIPRDGLGWRWSRCEHVSIVISTLLSQKYFSRTWILTEFTHVKRLDFVCGSVRCDFEDIHTLLDLSAEGDGSFTLTLMESAIGHRHCYFSFVRNDRSGYFDSKLEVRALEDCIKAYSKTACQNPREKVFAMLNHPFNTFRPQGGRSRRLRPDYAMGNDELLVRTMAWIYDTCEDFQMETYHKIDLEVNTPRIASYVVEALGIEAGVKDERTYDMWLATHYDWSCLPNRIRLPDGTSVIRRELLGAFLLCAERSMNG